MSETSTYAAVLARALANAEAPLEIAPVILEAARKNDKRPAYMKFLVEDRWVMNLGNDNHFTDLYMVVRVPKENFASPPETT